MDVPDPFREPVSLSDVDAAWPQQYTEAAARIAAALAVLRPTIEHIGSTSVPLRGKPIVDIQVAVEESDRRAPSPRSKPSATSITAKATCRAVTT